MIDSIVVFDGTSYFVESIKYLLNEDETVVFSGSFKCCAEKCAQMNERVYDKPRSTWTFGFLK